MKNKKLFTNIVFAVVILAIAAVLLVVRRVHASGAKLRAELIYGDNNTTMNLPLDVDETYDVDTGYYTVHIQIKDGAARFVDSPCPDHIKSRRAAAHLCRQGPSRLWMELWQHLPNGGIFC